MQLHNPAPQPEGPDAHKTIPPLQPSNTNIERTGKKARRFALIVAVVLVSGFVVTHFMKSSHETRLAADAKKIASAPPLVDVVTAAEAPATLSLKLPGETAAWYESTIYARVDGYVGVWNADIGDHVKKGQVLATIETPDLDAQLAASRAKLQATDALVKSRQADADFAKTTYDRWHDSPKGVVSEQERDAKRAGFNSATAKLDEARAQVVLDQADVDRYSVLAKFKQVVAPYDGRITERHIDIGNLVTAGSGSNTTLLYRISQDNPIRVFVDVPQSAAEDMKVGVETHVTASNLPGHVFDAKISRTADAINPQTRTLKVEVDIPNEDQELLPGMYVDVSFDTQSTGLIQVPAAALIFRSAGPEIAVVDKDGRVNFHKVSIARDNGNTVEIGSGIKAGDQIAVNINNQISEGDKINVNQAK